jgi:hypothetical protein
MGFEASGLLVPESGLEEDQEVWISILGPGEKFFPSLLTYC